MKRLFTLIILSILLCGHAFAYDFSAVCSTGQTLYYNITSDIEPYTVEVTSENISNPYYNSYPEGNLEIPETVEYNSITYSVASIGTYAFYGCSGLSGITIPNSVTNIGASAFYGCNGLPEITIPNSVTRIGNDAFVSCSGLTSITIPEPVVSIGELAFNNCSGLTTVNFNATNCTTMGQTLRPVFGSGCTSLTTLNIGNNVTNIPKIAFDGCSGLSSVIIPNSVISIGNGAFEDCSGLTSVTIGNSVTRIGNLAFYGCSSLSEITIPNSVTEISPQAFASCSVLTTIAVEQENPIYDSRDNCNAIIETQTNTLIAGCMNTIIPNSVTSIGEYAFSSCSGLASVTIPNSVTSIGSHAFYNCTGLTSVTIPNSITSIGDWAFYGCSSLTSIAIGNSVASIGSNAFNNTGWYNNQTDGILYLDNWCLGYKGDKPTGSLTITDGTNGIAGNAFSSCDELTGVLTIPASVTIIGSSAFSNCDGLTEISIGNSVASIGDYAFSDCMGLTTVSIPNSVTSIGGWAFTNCSGLTTVNFNATNCTTMGRPIFGTGCTSLTTLNIGDNVTNIPAAAFSGCRNLTSVTIPNSVTSIGNNAFSDCSGLTGTLTIPNSVTSIGNNAFSDCTELTTLNFNARNCISMGSTGSSAVFKDCTSLATLNIGENVKNIPDYAFYNCSSLTDTLTIPDSVTNIGTSAFYNCSGLTTVIFNATNCTSLGTDSGMAFFGCTNITNVTFGNNVTRIPDYAFTNCSGIDSVSFPESVTSIGVAAFRGSSISEITIPTAVTSIDIGAITLCSSLSSVNFNATNCSTVSSGTSNSFSDIIFTGCPISNLTIGSNVETIPDNTFNSCTSLDTIKCYANNPPTIYANSFNFGSLSMNTPVLVSCSAKDAYENADLWNNFQNIGPNCKAPSTHNGHEYVDLGLSVKWATVDVGATSPEEEGNLYSWGGTETKSMYEWINYEHCEGYEGMINKYFTDVSIGVTDPDNLTTLLPEDDAVTVSWGAGWRMPTADEVQELINNCTIEGSTINGNDNSITLNDAHYWTSSLYIDDQNNAYLYDNSSGSMLGYAARYIGYPVRGVYDATLATPTVTTDSVSNIAPTSANLYGTLTNEDGVPETTEFGFKYGTDSQSLTETIQGENGTVGFIASLTGLSSGTTYYYRAYATNSNGTGYGEIKSFTTPSGTYGGHNYVDLGLPSGTLWATTNVGAYNPEDYGNYYSWGEVTFPDTYESYDWSEYDLCNGSSTTINKYCTNGDYGTVDNLTTLSSSNDAATANWGNSWRMPTSAEYQELIDNCTWEWSVQDGKEGYLVSSNGNSIFLPAAGFFDASGEHSIGVDGNYWTKSLREDYPTYAMSILFYSGTMEMFSQHERPEGLPIRPVYVPYNTDVIYSSDFEDADENANWTLANTDQTNQWHIGTAASHGGENGLYISNDDGTSNAYDNTANSYVYAYHNLNIDEDGYYIVSFDWKAQGEVNYDLLRAFITPTSAVLEAGNANSMTSSNNTTPSGWTDVANPQGQLSRATEWQQSSKETYLDAGTYNLVFFWKNDGTGGSQPPAAIDNVSVTKISCPSVASITVSEITTESASISWTERGSAESWEIIVSNTALNETQLESYADVGTATSTTYSATGLSPATTFYVYVRAACSSDEKSLWTSTSFISGQNTVTLPYTCDFENTDENNNWALVNGDQTNKWHIGAAASNGGSNGLYVTNDSGTSNAYTNNTASYIYAYRTIEFPESATYSISFDWKAQGEGNYDLLRAFIVPTSTVLEAGNANGMTYSNNSAPSGWTDIANPEGKLNLASDWQQSTKETYLDAGTYNLVFFWKNNNSISTQPPAAIDNVSIKKVTCLSVTNIRTSSITTSSAYINWHESANASSWEVIVSDTELGATALENYADATVVYDSSYNATGLNVGTKYYAYIRAVCSDSDKSLWQNKPFRTKCNAITVSAENPYSEDFNSYSGYTTGTNAPTGYPNHTMPDCWEFANMSATTSTYPQIFLTSSTTYAVSGLCLLFKASSTTPAYAILPPFSNSIENLSLEFIYKNQGATTANGTLHVGISNDISDLDASYVDIKSFEQTTTKTTAVVNFATETVLTGEYYIVFKYVGGTSSNYGLSIDNVSVRFLSSDAEITAFTFAEDAEIANINSEAATIISVVAYSTADLNGLVPTIIVSDGASISPESGVAQDFTSPVTYTVTAENGTTKEWTVSVSKAATASPAKDILSFTFNGQVGESVIDADSHTITAYAEWDYDISNIIPTITISQMATISPASGTAQDFTYPVSYTVTAEDLSSQTWTITILHDPNACPNPEQITVSNITGEIATLSWQQRYLETSYNVKVSSTEMSEMTATADIYDNLISSTTLDLTGLTRETTYYVYVQSACGNDEGWVSTTFTTIITPATIPYTCDFEEITENDNWKLANGDQTNKWYIGSAANNGGENGLYISNDDGVSNTYTLTSTSYVYAYRNFNIDEDGVYTVNFDWRAKGTGYYNLLRAFIVPTSVVLEAGTANGMASLNNPTPSGWIDIANPEGILNNKSEWQQSTKEIALDAGTYNLVFFWKNAYSQGNQPPAAIDNISITKTACPSVTNLRTTDITDEAVTLGWNENGEATSWEVIVSTEELTDDALESHEKETAADSSYLKTGLTALTKYYAYVRAACSADNNSLWKSTTFWTGGIPVVTTLYTDTRTNTTATLKAKAISTEDVNYTFYYGTDRNNMSVIADATPTVTDSIATIQLSNLNPEVWYYYTAEATNSYGTVRGDTLVFLTCGQITDDRDGNQYYTIQIGDQKWMAQNLKYVGPEVSLGETTSETEPYYYYVNGNEANTDTYGYLYNWPAAMNGESSSEENPSGVQGICPNGWHLPSDAEWTQLTNAIGGFSNAGAMMVGDSRLWQSGTNLTISPYIGASGFNALPAGFYDGSYSDIRYAACFWSSTANTSGALLRRIIYASPSVISNRFDKYDGFSIRCVKGTTIYAYDTINYCGEQYTFGTQTLTANGDYQETFSLGTDKDSVVYLHLTMYPTLTATISYSNGCYGANNGFVEVSADGGAGSYTYNWNTTETQTTALVNNLGAGEYSVTISDAAGCTATFSQTLTTPTELTASINGNNPNCYDDETTLEAIVSGGSPDYTYAWNTSETTESIIVTPTATTSYTVTVTDANDCSVEASKNVTVPSELTVSVSCNTAIQCFGGTTDLTANPEGGSMGYTYTWSNDATNPIITEVGAGDYSVTITDGNGCTATTSTNVSQPDQLTNEISHTACESYDWNGTTYTETGDFQQTFANVNGCDSVVTLHLTISNTITTEISDTACDSYQWNDSTYYASGEYIQTFYTGDGCDSIVTLHLTINGSTTGEFAAQMCSGVPYEYNGQNFDEAGTYYVTLVNANGCDSIVTLTLTYANNCNRTISGIITDASTGNAIPSAKVTVGNMITWTNNAGEYSMPVTNGNIAFRVAAIGYASFFEFINIQSDTIINVSLDFPLLQIDNNNITITTYPYLESSDTLTLENNGNATLVWSSITEYDNIELLPEDEEQHQRRNLRSLWDSIQTFTTQFNAEQAIATDGFFIYTSSWQRPGEFNRYTPDGEYIETFFVENVGMIRNLSYDGTYFYATEASNIIFKLDLNNQMLVDSITTDISNIRHCSFDRQNGNLLAGDWNSLYSIDTASGTSTQIRNDLANVYSSAFDNLSPGGPYLWMFLQTSQDNGPSAYIRQFNLNSSDYTDKTHYLDDIGLGSTSLAGGICASEQIKEGRFVLLANIQNPSGNNTIATYEIGRTNSIVTAEIKSGKIQPNESMKIVIHEHATEVGEFNSTISYRAAVMGSQANDVNITVSAIAPECNAVQNITAVTDTFHTITLDWQPVELGEYDNVSYLIYRNDMQNDIDTISETSITYENISVGEHCFNVRAMFVGEHTCISNASDTVCAEIQDIPCNVTLTVDATNDGEAIFLTWNKPVGIEYFTIYRNDNTFDEVLYDSNYMDTNVVPEVTYCYTIFAHFEDDACNELVTTVCTKIISGICASAPELNVEAFDNSIVLNWTGSDDTYNYKIFRNNEPIGVTTETTFYEKVARGFTYCYKVKSICDYGMFVYSDEKCIFVPETGDGENSIYEWTDDNLSVYPNPTYDQFFIEGQQIATVQIFNAIGQLVSEIENSEDERITINCNSWNPGLYNVQIISNEGKVATRKVSIFK